jgi:tetratricopeptide (TPR) repeat protein
VLETLSQRQTAHSNDAGSDDDVWAIEIRNTVAAALCLRGELDRPMELFVRNEPAIRRLGEHHQLAENLINQSHVYLHRNRLDDAMVRLKEAEAICARHGYLDLLQACLGNLGVCHRLQKRYPEAMNLHERQERICVELGNLLGRAQALGQQGLVFRARGERAEAMGRFQAQASLCRSIHNSYWLGFALGMLAELFTADGRYAEAAAALEEQEPIHRQMGASAELAICLAKRAKLLITYLGRSEDGRLVADQARAAAQTSGDATAIERTTRLLQLGDPE